MASSAALELIIGVTDKASGPLKSIAGGLATLGKIGAGAVLGGAVAGVGALSAALVTGIGDAREANIIMAQTEAVIKSTGGAAGVTAGHIADLSGELSAASGKSLFGDSQIQESANLLLTFTNLKGGVLDAATAMSVDLAQAMGGAPADAAVQLGKALNSPKDGVSALTRVGVTFTKEQQKLITTLQDSGDMAGAQGVILAELQKEFGGSAAAAAAADGGFTQFRDRMGELAESVGAQVLPALNSLMGWLNSPAVQAGINAVVDGLVGGVTSIINTVKLLATGDFSGGIFGLDEDAPFINALFVVRETLIGIATNALPVLLSGWQILQTAFNLARDSILTFIAAYNGEWQNSDKILLIHQAFGVLGQVLGTVVVPALQSMIGWFQQNTELVTRIGVAVGIAVAVFATLSTVVGIVGTVTTAITGMGAAVTTAGGVLGAIVAVLGGPVTIALGAVALAAGALALAWQTNFGGIQEKTAAVVAWWTGTAQPAIKAGFDRVVETVTGMKAAWDRDFESVRGFIQTLQAAWDTAVAAVGVAIDLAKGYISGFRDTVETKIAEAVAFFTGLPAQITAAVSSFPSLLLQAGKDLIQGLIDGLKSIDVGSVLGGILTAGIAAAKAMVGIHSPSTKTRDEIGKPMGEGIVAGIEGSATSVKQAMGKTVLGAVQVAEMIEPFHKAGKTVATAFKGGLAEGLDDEANVKQILGGKLRNAVEVAAEDVKQILGGKLRDGGASAMGEFGNGLAEGWENVKQIFGGKLRELDGPAAAAGERAARVLIAGFSRIMQEFDFGGTFGGAGSTFAPGPGHTDPPPSPKGPRTVTANALSGGQSYKANAITINLTINNPRTANDVSIGLQQALQAAGLA